MAKIAGGFLGFLAVFGAYMYFMDFILMKAQGLSLIP